jgi:hypothetical protein
MDGTQTLYVKSPVFGMGFKASYPDGPAAEVWLDDAYVVMQTGHNEPDPAPGSSCDGAGSAAMRVGDSGVFFCTPPIPRRTDSIGWTWKRLAWQP